MAFTRSCVCSWGYVILVSKFMLLLLDTGIAKSFGVLIPMMVDRLDSDYATVGLICSMPSTLMYLAFPIVTPVVKKVNNRFVAMLGGLLSGSCILACAFIKNTVTAGVCLALSGVGLSMAYVPTTLAINEYFRENFVFLNTFTYYGYTVGSMLLPVVTEKSFQAYGYTGAFIILGGIAFNIVVCGATIRQAPCYIDWNTQGEHQHEDCEEQIYLIEELNRDICDQGEKNRDEECSMEQSGLIQHNRQCNDSHRKQISLNTSRATFFFQNCKQSCGLLNESLFLFSIPIHFLIFYTLYAWMLFLVPHAEHLGIAPSQAVFLSTIGGIGGVIGRTFFIILVGKGFNVFIIYIIVSITGTASFLLDFISSVYQVRAVMAFVQGFCFFIEDTVMMTFCKEAVFDDRNFDMAIAISGFTGGVGATCSGLFTGYLFDVTQSFTKVFITVGFIKAVVVGYIILMVILIKRRQ